MNLFMKFTMKSLTVQNFRLCLIGFGSILMLSACASQPASIQTISKDEKCQVNNTIERNVIPQTPHYMSLPEFGQGVIGWATGPEGAKNRFENIQKGDLKAIQEKGTTLAMVREWQAFYENEVQRNPCNPTAPYRAELMKKIAWMWNS